MNKIPAAILAMAICIGPAFALELGGQPPSGGTPNPGVETPTNDAPPAAANQQPPTSPPGNLHVDEKLDCKPVSVFRPDVNQERPEITIRFRVSGGNPDVLKGIKGCQDAKDTKAVSVTEAFGGIQVRFATQGGAGKIALPIALTDGTADQVTCNLDRPNKKITHAKYAAQWSGALPDEIKLQKLDSYDREAADNGCRAALPPELQALLK